MPNLHVTSAASSLKFCPVAEGKADIYLRYGTHHGVGYSSGAGDFAERGRQRRDARGRAVSLSGKNQSFENVAGLWRVGWRKLEFGQQTLTIRS